MIPLAGLLTGLIADVGVKAFGELLEKGMEAMEKYLARKDLTDKVRQEGQIAALQLANRALDLKARLRDHPGGADLVLDPGIPDTALPGGDT